MHALFVQPVIHRHPGLGQRVDDVVEAHPRPLDRAHRLRHDRHAFTHGHQRDGGLEVQAGEDGATGFIKRSDLGRDRDEQRPDRFQVGQKLDAMITGFDRSKKPNFSVKARQMAEEKEAVEQYGSSDAGASLGDILGAALKAKKD